MLKSGYLVQNRYTIDTLIDSGGMAHVYLARHTNLEMPVAIKILRSLSGDTERAKALLRREAKTLAHLDHPHIARVFDLFEENGALYLVMEFVHGITLVELIVSQRQQVLPEIEAVPIMLQIVSALQYLHSRPVPVVMRDLKPSNVLITPTGHVKLIDFGIAREATLAQGTGVTVGSTARSDGYAPLEQYGGSTDYRSDYYALGATLYFLLTGQDPPSAIERMTKKAELSRPLGVSSLVWETVERLMSPAPSDRPASLADVCGRWCEATSTLNRPPQAPPDDNRGQAYFFGKCRKCNSDVVGYPYACRRCGVTFPHSSDKRGDRDRLRNSLHIIGFSAAVALGVLVSVQFPPYYSISQGAGGACGFVVGILVTAVGVFLTNAFVPPQPDSSEGLPVPTPQSSVETLLAPTSTDRTHSAAKP